MSYTKYALGAVGAVVLMAASQASALTLQDLVSSNGSITNNGLIFSNFTDGGTLPATGVTITPTTNGLEFTANWNTLTPGHDLSVISYTVSVDPATAANGGTLSGASLFFAGQVIVGSAAATVGETITDLKPGTGGPYSLQVFFDGPGGQPDVLKASTTFNPEVTQIRVVKSIDVNANTGSFAALNFVDNTFVQGGGNPPPIPEPMSLALLPLALAGLGLRKKLAS